MSTDLTRSTATELAGLIAGGEVSAVEVAQAHLDRISEVDDRLHAFLVVDADGALRAAKAVDARRAAGEALGPLAGVPLAMKDIVVTEGLPTTAGSKILEGWVPPYDATISRRIKDAGIVMLGKTNLDEFAMGSSTENSAFGPTHNPWDPERVPGGSSGGSAAAVAGGLAPAALCGIVGLRPTYGTVSRYGIVAFASSLDQVGPLTKTVRDCALLYRIIAGRDPCDSTTVELPEPVEIPEREDLKGLRVGVPRQLNEAEGIEPGVKAAVAEAIELCGELGAEVGECELPLSVEYGMPCYYLIAPAEASSNLARYDGVRYGFRAAAERRLEMYERTRDEGF